MTEAQIQAGIEVLKEQRYSYISVTFRELAIAMYNAMHQDTIMQDDLDLDRCIGLTEWDDSTSSINGQHEATQDTALHTNQYDAVDCRGTPIKVGSRIVHANRGSLTERTVIRIHQTNVATTIIHEGGSTIPGHVVVLDTSATRPMWQRIASKLKHTVT